MGITELVRFANTMLNQSNYENAIPALQEVIERTKYINTDSMRETLQKARLQLGRAFFQRGEGQRAMPYLEDYLNTEPRDDERMVLRLLARGYLEAESWDKAEEFAARLLSMSRLSEEDKLYGNLLYGQALFRLEKWEQSVDPLVYAVNNSTDEDVLKTAQIFATRAMVNAERWQQLFDLVQNIFRTDNRYNITLNITLMQAGKTLFEDAAEKTLEEGRSDLLNALFLYRMVLSREELINFANQRIDALTAEKERLSNIALKAAEIADVQDQIENIRESVTELNDLPPYEEEISFRIGQIYAEVKRYWEAYILFNGLYEKDRTSEIGEASVVQSVMVLYDMQEKDRAEERILRYLNEQPDGLYTADLLYMMMENNIDDGNYDRVAQMRPYVNRVTESSEDEEMNARLRYLLAFGFFLSRDYDSSDDQFGIIIDNYPSVPMWESTIYYRGMAYLMQGKYAGGYADFVKYQELGEDKEHYANAMFREGVCLFGMEKIQESEAALTRFIETFPNDPLASEAYSLRGDIEAAKEGSDDPATPDVDESDPHTLDRALADYQKAIEKHSNPRQAAYAAFQAAKVYQLESKWQEIIDLMNDYLELLGDQADVAKAVFWIGQSRIQMDRVDEAVTAYLDAIERFGNDPQQYGVDQIILELVNDIALRHLSDAERTELAETINRKLNAAEAEAEDVLKLRLRVAKAYLEGDEAVAALGEELVDAQQPLSAGTPISLTLMCDAAIKAGEPALMGELFDYFLEHFEEADELWNAYRAKVHQLLAEEAYDNALQVIDEVQGLYGVEPFMGWAQITKANILYKMDEYKQAEDAYNTIMGVPQWRGSLWAEAYLGMARCRLSTRDYETAHAYFQRTYLLFGAYDDGKWAAEGYLGAADCLVRLGRSGDAVNTLNEMLEDSYVNTLPQVDTARELIKKYGGA